MRRILLALAAPALAGILAACNPIYGYEPHLSSDSLTVVAPAGSMLSSSSVTLAAGSSAHVTFGLRLNCAPGERSNLTADGCQYIVDGVPRRHEENIWVSMPITSTVNQWDGTVEVNDYYPTFATIPGVTFTFGQDPLPMDPVHDKITTTTLTVTADASATPGTYTVYVGLSSGSSVLDTTHKQPLTIHITEPVRAAMTEIYGTITNHDPSLENPRVVLRRGEEDLIDTAVNPVGLFSSALPSSPGHLRTFDYEGCTGTISDAAALHTGASVMVDADNLEYALSLHTDGPEGYDFYFLLFVDRPVTIDMECESFGYTAAEQYEFPEAGWYPVFARWDGTTTDYTTVAAGELTGNWTIYDPSESY